MSRHATTVSTMPSESPRFSSNKLFSGIAPDLVAELEIIPEPVDFAPDVVIFREGEPAECLFLIAEGEVRISKRGRFFGTGEIEGVVAPETAAHAAGTSALLPMISLGVPGSPTPVGGAPEGTMWVSTVGASELRSTR